ncbi:MAG: ABC transporter permease, partial [Bacteroidota bacterium]
MNLAYLAYRNMISKPLNLILSLLLLVLSVLLVTFILQLSKQLNGQIDKNIDPVDMVVGAKGSPLQLVLSSVLHIDVPTGNIQLGEANTIKNHPFVGSAIPVSYGDNYKGYRILGTELAYFESYGAVLKEGRYFEQTFEAVVGSSVAKKLGLKIGDVFTSSHGLVAANAHAHEDHPYTIVGLLEPTGTVLDQLLVSNLQSVWDAHAHEDEEEEAHDHEGDDHEGHDHEGHDHEGDDHEGDDHEGDDHEGDDHEGDDHEGDDHEGDDHEGHD